MNTPINKRYSSSSEYGTPGAVDDSENSLYFSFTGDDNTPNKENSNHREPWSQFESARSSTKASHSLKTKTPLLRKVLQSSFTPQNERNKPKQVSFGQIIREKPAEKIAKITLVDGSIGNSSSPFDQKSFGENDIDANSETADDMDNTIIENPLVKHGNDFLAPTSEFNASNSNESNKMDDNQEETSTNSKTSKDTVSSRGPKKISSEMVAKPLQTRNVTKLDRRRLVNDNRKSMLPVVRISTRSASYKRRSSTYEPRKIDPRKSLEVLKQVANKLSKSVSGK